MIPEAEHPSTLQQMISAGEARAPVETGMPDVQVDLLPDLGSLADILIADRDRERHR
jgi:hypothetical protein